MKRLCLLTSLNRLEVDCFKFPIFMTSVLSSFLSEESSLKTTAAHSCTPSDGASTSLKSHSHYWVQTASNANGNIARGEVQNAAAVTPCRDITNRPRSSLCLEGSTLLISLSRCDERRVVDDDHEVQHQEKRHLIWNSCRQE